MNIKLKLWNQAFLQKTEEPSIYINKQHFFATMNTQKNSKPLLQQQRIDIIDISINIYCCFDQQLDFHPMPLRSTMFHDGLIHIAYIHIAFMASFI